MRSDHGARATRADLGVSLRACALRPTLGLALLLAVAGCDAFSDDGPAWAQPGTVATFDYLSGPDSLHTYGPFRAIPDTPAAVRMTTVRASDRGRKSDRYVVWESPGYEGYRTPFASELTFPLDDEDIKLGEDGLMVVVPHDCTGNGWFGGSSGALAYVRVPRRAGTLQAYGHCSNEPAAPFPATGPEAVTVPAGTFQAIRIERGRQVEWWSWEVGLVRLDVFGYEDELQGRFVRSAGL